MAKVTFIIGNGFDLNCGLKTRFSDMYPSYTQIHSENPAIEDFKKNIRDEESLHFTRWSDFEMGMARYAEKWNCEEELLACLEDFTTHMIHYIDNEQKAFSERINGRARLYASRELIDSISAFYKALPHNDPVRRFDALLKDGIVEIDFLIFNYTSVFDALLSAALANADTAHMRIKYHAPVHIHGMLNGPVLGVDNEQQLHLSNYQLSPSGRRAFIKPWYNKEYDSAKLQSSLNIIRDSNVICIFGKRFGESDLMWNRAIGDWLSADSAHELVYFDHSASEYISVIPWKRMDYEDDTKAKLIDQLNGENSILSQIHVPIGVNIFNIASAVQSGIDFEEKNRIRSTGSRR